MIKKKPRTKYLAGWYTIVGSHGETIRTHFTSSEARSMFRVHANLGFRCMTLVEADK